VIQSPQATSDHCFESIRAVDGANTHWQLLPKSLSFGEISEIRPMPTRNISLTPEQDALSTRC
jgi:hypothetical protein